MLTGHLETSGMANVEIIRFEPAGSEGLAGLALKPAEILIASPDQFGGLL